MRFLRRLIPGPLKRVLVRSVDLRAMLREDARLRTKEIALRDEHVRNATLLPGTTALLERLPRGGVVAEIGVAEGDFSAAILSVTAPTTLHLIDLWGSSVERFGPSAHARVVTRFAADIGSGRVRIHRGLSWDMLAMLDDRSLDWAYLDAAHDYESVARDLAALLPKLKPDGLIVGDDYVMWAGQTGRYGVVEAVNELCLREGFEFVHLAMQRHMHLKYALRRIGAGR